jgi:hypothetical protein
LPARNQLDEPAAAAVREKMADSGGSDEEGDGRRERAREESRSQALRNASSSKPVVPLPLDVPAAGRGGVEVTSEKETERDTERETERDTERDSIAQGDEASEILRTRQKEAWAASARNNTSADSSSGAGSASAVVAAAFSTAASYLPAYPQVLLLLLLLLYTCVCVRA